MDRILAGWIAVAIIGVVLWIILPEVQTILACLLTATVIYRVFVATVRLTAKRIVGDQLMELRSEVGVIERLGVAAELPFPIHAHMLRHAARYALAGRGIDTRTLQAFMGHRSIANTVVYTAVADKRIRNIWGK
jgi:integrase